MGGTTQIKINSMRTYTYIFLIQVFNIGFSYSQTKLETGNLLNLQAQHQANIMGNAFIKGDYETFEKYTYPAIVNAMGGKDRMTAALINSANDRKAKGMIISSIIVDNPSKIVKSGSELQCTLQQHTTIKLNNGTVVATSTLIAISLDGGKNWSFVDTSNKDASTMRKMLPNLSTAIIIPPEQQPVYYKE